MTTTTSPYRIILAGSASTGKSAMLDVLNGLDPNDVLERHVHHQQQQQSARRTRMLVPARGGIAVDVWEWPANTPITGNEAWALVFLIDATSTVDLDNAMTYITKTLQSVVTWQRAYVLVTKMDLLGNHDKQLKMNEIQTRFLLQSTLLQRHDVKFLATSIVDGTLHQAWGEIFRYAIPEYGKLETNVMSVCGKYASCMREMQLVDASTLIPLVTWHNQLKNTSTAGEGILTCVRHARQGGKAVNQIAFASGNDLNLIFTAWDASLPYALVMVVEQVHDNSCENDVENIIAAIKEAVCC